MIYKEYIKSLIEMLDEAVEIQGKNIQKAAQIITECIKNDGIVHVFGSSHAGILAEELFYRAGGLAAVSPIFGEELMLNLKPITRTSAAEKLHGYGSLIMKGYSFKPADVMIVSSNSGRNPVPIEVAMEAKNLGLKVIAVTSLEFSRSISSRHNSGKRLFEIADLVIDNNGIFGDAIMEIKGYDTKFCPSSNIIGCALMHSVMAQVIENLFNMGIEPPVFTSANTDDGESKNRKLLEKYKGKVSYL